MPPFTPGIVAGWRQSRHASVSPETAGRVTGNKIPQALMTTSVGCAECHGLRPDAHADTFEHNGYDIHVVVSPDDCAVCHREERRQFSENIMAMAYGNIANNALYQDLERTILGTPQWKGGRLSFSPANAMTRDQACYYCHGNRLNVTGLQSRDTDAGELSFPTIEGWPNQGVGRINPDNSKGACSACHPRHTFSMAMARKPDTCKECHKGPDVPAYKIYEISKHGHIYETTKDKWSFGNTPWTAGDDFTAPTCAACHISKVVNTDGDVLAERTHRVNDRLGYRIFGLFYAHPPTQVTGHDNHPQQIPIAVTYRPGRHCGSRIFDFIGPDPKPPQHHAASLFGLP